ncbi:MAG: hypothetical protein Q9201_003598 [Fulgogasparrea decipioides]
MASFIHRNQKKPSVTLVFADSSPAGNLHPVYKHIPLAMNHEGRVLHKFLVVIIHIRNQSSEAWTSTRPM